MLLVMKPCLFFLIIVFFKNNDTFGIALDDFYLSVSNIQFAHEMFYVSDFFNDSCFIIGLMSFDHHNRVHRNHNIATFPKNIIFFADNSQHVQYFRSVTACNIADILYTQL